MTQMCFDDPNNIWWRNTNTVVLLCPPVISSFLGTISISVASPPTTWVVFFKWLISEIVSTESAPKFLNRNWKVTPLDTWITSVGELPTSSSRVWKVIWPLKCFLLNKNLSFLNRSEFPVLLTNCQGQVTIKPYELSRPDNYKALRTVKAR
jgi:hypothetical protein